MSPLILIYNRKSCAGFSLTELVIVLAVVSVILSGSWVVLDMVREKMRREEAIMQIATVVQKTRDLYGGRGDMVGDASVITDQLIRTLVIPSEMIVDRVANPLTARNPWGGIVTVDDNTAGNCSPTDPAGATRQQSFCLTFGGLDYGQCMMIATRIGGVTDAPKGMFGNQIVINGNPHSVPVLNAAASGANACQLNNANWVAFAYRLRQ